LHREHVERPGGFVEGRPVEWALETDAESNTVAIVDEFYRRRNQVRSQTPDGIQISRSEALIDNSQTIRDSFEQTMFALVFGGLLAVFVMFGFMRRSRPTMIAAAAIPLSLIATFGLIVFD
jgi:hydrophobic/amphiphilic exporter-1 (mainly G- bacteria), HAE1 family